MLNTNYTAQSEGSTQIIQHSSKAQRKLHITVRRLYTNYTAQSEDSIQIIQHSPKALHKLCSTVRRLYTNYTAQFEGSTQIIQHSSKAQHKLYSTVRRAQHKLYSTVRRAQHKLYSTTIPGSVLSQIHSPSLSQLFLLKCISFIFASASSFSSGSLMRGFLKSLHVYLSSPSNING